MADQLCETHHVCGDNSENNSVIAGENFTEITGKGGGRASAGKGWAAAIPMIIFETGERIAYHAVFANQITFMTEVLHMSTASAAVNINIWSGSVNMLALFGAFLSDSYLGCYRTVFYSSLVYLLGLFSLTLLAALPLFSVPSSGKLLEKNVRATTQQLGWFFISFYLVALGGGGHKPCLQTLGAEQFDDSNPKQAKQKASFFNWWVLAGSCAYIFSINVFVYVQEYINWGLGFGIPTLIMALTFFIFILWSPTYRHCLPKSRSSAFAKVVRILIAACWDRVKPAAYGVVNQDSGEVVPLLSNHSRFRDNITMVRDEESQKLAVFTSKDAEEEQIVLKLIPIWVSSLMYGVIINQAGSFFVKQGKAMNRKIGSHFEIPSAALQSCGSIAIFLLVPMYDRIFVPLARKMTRNPRGITMLQRIGIGLVVSTLSMIVAALIEMKRLKLVKELHLDTKVEAVVPMHISWLIPQYLLLGSSFLFAWVGMQEFFYDQMPETLKSLGIALMLSSTGIGGYLAGIMVSIIDGLSSMNGHHSWFDNNMNKAHFDYFYWLMAALSTLFFCMYVTIARNFPVKQGTIPLQNAR